MFPLKFQDYFKLINYIEKSSEMPVVESSPCQYTGVKLMGQVSLPMSFCEQRTNCPQASSVSLWPGKPMVS